MQEEIIDQAPGTDPEEVTEEKLVNSMALVVVVVVVGAILFLTILPWIKRMREQATEEDVLGSAAVETAEPPPT